MGFLDNSGDIILDAVLTDVGRRKLANGDFNIVKFAVGDDEIDYRLFDPQHASGSAYYDLEILQSPILEAGTKSVSSINYGLITYSRNDILYLPVLKLNEIITTEGASRAQGLFLKPVDSDTYRTLTSGTGLYPMAVVESVTPYSIRIESGLDTEDFTGNFVNRTTYLINTNLLDESFYVKYDSRFIEEIYGIGSVDASKEITSLGARPWTIPSDVTSLSPGENVEFIDPIYKQSTIYSLANMLQTPLASTSYEYSVINGPRGEILLFNMKLISSINFSIHGLTGQSLYGITTKTFSYLDTIVQIVGSNTGATIQIPIRIIKQDS